MTDVPQHDQFSLPHELPDTAAPASAPSTAPAEDWRARGLAHPAGRGWAPAMHGQFVVRRPEPARPVVGLSGEAVRPAPTPTTSHEREENPGAGSPSLVREGRESSAADGAGRDVAVLPEVERMGTEGLTVFSPERQSAFLAQLAESGNVRLACQAAGISPQTAYRARRKSAALAAAWDGAVLAARPIAEAALADRAMNGWAEVVYYRGEEIGHRQRFDTRLLLAHLARLDRLAAEAGERHAGGEAAALAALDAAIEAGARGEDLPEPQPVPVATSLGGAGSAAQDRMPGVPSSEARAAPAAPPCRRCGGRCNGPEDEMGDCDCQWLGHRIERYEAAWPDGVPMPCEIAETDEEAEDIEAMQLHAFEAGADHWWAIAGLADLDAAMAALPGDAAEDGAGDAPGEGGALGSVDEDAGADAGEDAES